MAGKAEPDRLLSIAELAEMLRISKASIYGGKCATSEIPRLKLGGHVMFELKAVEAWIAAKRREGERKILDGKIKTRQTVLDLTRYLKKQSK